MSVANVAAGVPAARQPLSRFASGPRSTGWWGILLLITIESVVVASLLFSYYYLRLAVLTWPPDGISPPSLLLPSINAAILFTSVLPVWWSERAARRGDKDQLKYGLVIAMALAGTFLTLKAIEYSDQSYTWRTNAYGSIVWTITGFHSAHVIGMLLKTAAITVLAWRGYFDERRHVAVQGNALYWYFVVGAWIPLFATLYLSPRVL